MNHFILSPPVDAMGVYGYLFNYGIVIGLVGSAFFIFIYLWSKKRLDMDEAPKFQMMQEETNLHDKEEHRHAARRKG